METLPASFTSVQRLKQRITLQKQGKHERENLVVQWFYLDYGPLRLKEMRQQQPITDLLTHLIDVT